MHGTCVHSTTPCTVTLTGPAPTAGGATVTLSSSNTAAATVPASVLVAAGANTATFTISTSPVAASTAVTISGTYGVTKTAILTVNPPTLSTLTLNPTTVTGGGTSTGTVTLTGTLLRDLHEFVREDQLLIVCSRVYLDQATKKKAPPCCARNSIGTRWWKALAGSRSQTA